MRIQQQIKSGGAWALVGGERDPMSAELALAFAPTAVLRDPAVWTELHALYPGARIVGCSTAGEISGVRVLDESLVMTAIAFDKSRAVAASVQLNEAQDGMSLGALLGARIPAAGLVHVIVLSDGLRVNGSALLAGLSSVLPAQVAVTGGLSGDGARFEQTAVCLDGPFPFEQVVAIGLYGPHLRVGYGSSGGWDPFGPERRITKAEGNVLFELDGEPALDLYRRYLGEHADGLPASGLLFPLAIRSEASPAPVVRTILSVDHERRSLTFAGDVPVGHRARLMRANLGRLVEGASLAAKTGHLEGPQGRTELALLISCVGRKLVLKQRVEEEVEAVRAAVGAGAVLAGFYSYGEMAPFEHAGRCELHNQTMTITTLSEV